jgi:hypothetical protein
MKTTIYSLLLIITSLFISCKKDKNNLNDPLPKKENLLIEEFTYDTAGVVFKITNDIDEAWNCQENIIEKPDSVYLKKFNFVGDDDPIGPKYTWFTKRGQYACWRYQYIDGGIKYMEIGFLNKHRPYIPYKYSSFAFTIGCTIYSLESMDFQRIFPKPVNDTVFVRLSAIRPDRFWNRKK